MNSLGLSIPLFNEVGSCEPAMRRLHAALSAENAPFQMVLVDNGSGDGTDAIVDGLATLPGVQALHLAQNRGYGGGIRAGLGLLETPLRGWHWGDGQVDPEVVVAAWRHVSEHNLDGVRTHRIRREDGLLRATQSRVYHLVSHALVGLDGPDLHGCPKIFTSGALSRLNLRSDDWLLDLETLWKAQALGLRVGVVPGTMRPRQGGASKVRWATAAAFAKALWDLRQGRPPWEGP